jgi:hypothetical protein
MRDDEKGRIDAGRGDERSQKEEKKGREKRRTVFVLRDS